MTRYAWLIAAGVCISGLLAGAAIRPMLFRPTHVSLQPDVVEIEEGIVEGDPIEVDFTLTNTTSRPILVKSVRASCGCMAVSGVDGPLSLPASIDAGGSMPIVLKISTAGRVGPQEFTLMAVFDEQMRESVSASAKVRATLLGSLRAGEPSIIFRNCKPGSAVATQVELADMLPDAGAQIREVVTTNAALLKVNVKSASGPSDIFGGSLCAQRRAILTVSYTPGATEGRSQEMITVVPENDRYPILQIPVICEIAEPDVRLRPRGLSIPPSAETHFRKVVSIESTKPIGSATVIECPNGVEAEIVTSAGNGLSLVVDGDASLLDKGHAEVVLLLDGEKVRFPMRVLP